MKEPSYPHLVCIGTNESSRIDNKVKKHVTEFRVTECARVYHGHVVGSVDQSSQVMQVTRKSTECPFLEITGYYCPVWRIISRIA